MATIKEVTALLAQVDNLDSPFWADLAQDDRTGIQAAIKKRQKELEKEATEDARLEAMLCYEKALYESRPGASSRSCGGSGGYLAQGL